MINITDKVKCCGCGACAQTCPKGCITLTQDQEGFAYPKVDTAACIECGLCEKVCPELHPYDEREPLRVIAAINTDEETRLASSSGGIFYLLAEKTISEGGVVFGAKFDDVWQVYITHAETMEEVRPFMGSKYVQARTGESYKRAEEFLKAGRKVLYSGSPCQIAGLKHYLRKEYDNLTAVDFVCHGAPSPKVWKMYLDEVIRGLNRSITDIKFRNKRDGWRKFNFKLRCDEEGKVVEMYSLHNETPYLLAFNKIIAHRPSCHNCNAKEGRSLSDITIADFWGVDSEHPEIFDGKGTSLIITNTPKGANALDISKLRVVESNYDRASKHNGGLRKCRTPHHKRGEFFAKLDSANSITDLIYEMTRPALSMRLKEWLKTNIKYILKKFFGFRKWDSQFVEIPGKEAEWSKMADVKHIESISFRNKAISWKQYCFRITVDCKK